MVVPLCGRTIASMRVDMVNDRRCNTWSDERRSASHGACMKLQGLITTVRAAAGVQIRGWLKVRSGTHLAGSALGKKTQAWVRIVGSGVEE